MSVARIEARCPSWAIWAHVFLVLAVPSLCSSLNAASNLDRRQHESSDLEQGWIWQGEPEIPADRRAEAERRLDAANVQLRAEMPTDWGHRSLNERARWVFEFMHRKLLTGAYESDQHAVSEALLSGRFNCVSATILFQYLADEAEIPVVPMQTRGHVWSRLRSLPPIDIETTCPDWFAWTAEQKANSPALQTSGAEVTLTQTGLTAKIPYNLATAAAARQDYSAALQYLNRAKQLDPNDAAIRKNHKAILHNWAVHCVLSQELDQAIVCIRQFAATEKASADKQMQSITLVDTVIQRWCQLNRYQDAVELVHSLSEDNALVFVPAKQKENWLVKIYSQWIESSLAAGRLSEAKNVLNWASADLQPSSPALAKLRWQIGHQAA